jgi:hypothetical protein
LFFCLEAIHVVYQYFLKHQTLERTRRGCSEKLIATGENTKKPQTGKPSLPMKKTKSSSLNFFVVFGTRIISQHVNACRPKRAVHNSCWYCCANLVISINLFLFPVPVSKRIVTPWDQRKVLFNGWNVWCLQKYWSRCIASMHKLSERTSEKS